MTRLYFVVPVHGREALTEVCLRQLARTCDAASTYGIEATAVIIGEGASLRVARTLGFATVKRNNNFLGRKFNDGYTLACDPEHNPSPADYVIPCGSDDWIDPIILQNLPPKDTLGLFRYLSMINPERTRLIPLLAGYTGGCGIRIIPSQLLARFGYRPAEEDRTRGIDMSTYGALSDRGHRPPKTVYLDVHPMQIVDWKSHGQQLNTFASLEQRRRGAESADPFTALAAHYPAESLEEMRAL